MKLVTLALSGVVLMFMIVGLSAPISAADDVAPYTGATVRQDIRFQIKNMKVTTRMASGQETHSSFNMWDAGVCNNEARQPPLHFHAYLTALVWF